MKKVSKIVMLLVVYFILMFLPMFLGFASPVLWFFYPVFSAFIAATPLLMGAKSWKGYGGVAAFPFFWYVLMILMGELKFVERVITPIIVIALAEVARAYIGRDKQMGLRISYAIASLVAVMQHLIIFTRTDYYYDGAVEEMGSTEYADAIIKFAEPGYFVLLIVLTLVVGYLGAIVSEKIFKEKVMVD